MRLAKTAVKKNLFANFFGVGVQLFNQIVLIPLYLHFWNVSLYGDWIILTAISSFFALSDVGLNSVTANQFVIKHTEGNMDECNSLLTNNYLLIISIFLITITLCSVYIFSFNIVNNLGLHAVSQSVGSYVFIILTCQIFIDMASSVLDPIYRANSLTHKSVYLTNVVRLSEGLVIAVSLFFRLSLPLMVSMYILPRCFSFLYKHYNTKLYFNYTFSLKQRNWLLFKKVVVPSLTFMSFPLGNAILLQGFSLLVNKYFGASSLVLYNTTRTLVNFVKSILTTLQLSVWPEYSIAYGKNDVKRMKQLHQKTFVVATLGSLILSICLLLTGNFIYHLWTNGVVTFDFNLMLSFLLVLICRNIWLTSSVCLMATNKHSILGILYIISAFLSICIALVVNNYFHSLSLVVCCQLIVDSFLSYYALTAALKMTEDTVLELLISYKTYIYNIKKQILKITI